jgi:GNAT superfamily N-acetyltransferase
MSSSKALFPERFRSTNTLADIPHLLRFIAELADYEKEPESNHSTHEKLASSLTFAPKVIDSAWPEPLPLSPLKPATSLIAFGPNGEAAGMALYFTNYSTWRASPGIYLEDLYVTPEFRGKGYGLALLQGVAKECMKIGGQRLDWVVLKWNEPSIRFYESGSVGAYRMDEWVGCRVEGEKLERLAGSGASR